MSADHHPSDRSPEERAASRGRRGESNKGDAPPRGENGREDAAWSAVEHVSRASLTASRLEDLLALILRETAALAGADAGTIWLVDTRTGRPRLAGRIPEESHEEPSGIRETWGPLVEEAIREGRPARARIEADGGVEETVAHPLVAFDETVGALAIRARPAVESAPLRILCAQAAAAIQTSRLFERVHASARRLKAVEREVLRNEKLATLGEMSAKVAHEIRNPLAAIGGFARRIEKGLPEDDPKRSYTGIILKEIGRLEALLGEQLEIARSPAPRFQMVDPVDLVRDTLALVREEIERKGVRLIRRGGGAVPSLLLDPDRVKQVLLNILKNAVGATSRGQEIHVGTRASDGWMEIEIANNGERMPGEILESLFVPFASAREGGCGLGMAVADQIIKEHGGEIRVRSTREWSAVFTISLPIRTNEDRRRTPERRRRERRRVA
ncbi:MAG: GAF domain-containing protein [Candidatus Eisenbacteria bacterium]|nr:GAF domain-containing protein [Candidatus Latescibacterota bacterium]MBD3301034.1 GAF domain-containing protein [Candidatus Eisenbacteria bacterium]